MTVPPPWSARTISGFLAAKGAVCVAEEGAFALGRVIADDAELLTIAVDPEKQGRGIGRACLLGFLEMCHKAGAKRVFLEVAESNLAARALYAAEGFKEDGMRKGYYAMPGGGSETAILMSRLLEPESV